MAEPVHQPRNDDSRPLQPALSATKPGEPGANPEPALILQNPAWVAHPWLQHGFSTRHGGVTEVYGAPTDLNLGWTKEDSPASVKENRRRLIAALSQGQPDPPELITLRQTHSNNSLIVPDTALPDSPSPGQPLCEGDGLITATPGLLLGIQTADCVPILVVDLRLRVVAAFHAGWRGTVASIVERGIATFTDRFGSAPTDLSATIGPAIGPCCYTVGKEVHTRFHEAFPCAEALFQPLPDQSRQPTWTLNLWEANHRQLLHSGLHPDAITILPHCTACSRIAPAATSNPKQPSPTNRQFFSYRAESGVTGRMMSVIGITTGSDAIPQ